MGTRPQKDALEEMLEQASVSTLSALVKRLTITHVGLVAECCEFLLEHADLSAKQRSGLASEQVASIWNELSVHIDELDEYGGGEDSIYESVWELTQQLVETVNNNDVGSTLRQQIVKETLGYIESDNAGVSDELYDIVLSCSISVEEKISLAKFFESLPSSSYISRALSIYRELEYVEDYLRLRQSSLCYGADYLDLATFYDERGDKEKGLLLTIKPHHIGWETSYERRFAKQLENLYPKLIFDYYIRALGKVEKSTRKTYAQQSRVCQHFKMS